MPFCPECRSVFKEGILICAGCGTNLVGELPLDTGVEYIDWKIVQSVSSEILGNILKGVLENGGIEAVLRSHEMPSVGSVQGDFSPDWGDVLVQPKDFGSAQELIELYLASLPADQSENFDAEDDTT